MTAYFLENEPTSFSTFLSKPLWGGGVVKASVNSANKKSVGKTRNQASLP